MAQPYDPTTSNQIAPYDANTDSAGTGRYDAGLSSAASSYQAKPIPPALIKAMAYYAKMVVNGRKLEMEYAAYQAEYLQVITREAELTRLREAGSGALSAWCADYTTDLSGTVATLEVSGEVNPLIGGGINIKPGYVNKAVYHSSYGKLQRSALLSEAGFAWNLTMLQPWMKWTPFWRYATVTGKDEDNDTVNVNLLPILSKARAWLAHQTDFNEPWDSSMAGVPVEYMSCGAKVFDVGDEVIIEFRQSGNGGLDYLEPYCIGFKQEPKRCIFPEFCYVRMNQSSAGRIWWTNVIPVGWTGAEVINYQQNPDFIAEVIVNYLNTSTTITSKRINNYQTARFSSSEFKIGGDFSDDISGSIFNSYYDYEIANDRVYYRHSVYDSLPAVPGSFTVQFLSITDSTIFLNLSNWQDELYETVYFPGTSQEITYYSHRTVPAGGSTSTDLGLGVINIITPPSITMKHWDAHPAHADGKFQNPNHPDQTQLYIANRAVYLQSYGYSVNTAIFGTTRSSFEGGSIWIEYRRA